MTCYILCKSCSKSDYLNGIHHYRFSSLLIPGIFFFESVKGKFLWKIYSPEGAPLPHRQPSVLGPLLFLVYINDINCKLTNCDIKLFADDTVLHVKAATPIEAVLRLQNNLNELAKWCALNRLSINVKKSKSMVVGTKRFTKNTDLPNLKLGADFLDFTNNYKYLGVILDSRLDVQLHLKKVHQTASHKNYVLSLLKTYLTQDAALLLYKYKILPCVDYGDIFYHRTHNKFCPKSFKNYRTGHWGFVLKHHP